jgi:hypothetical protein
MRRASTFHVPIHRPLIRGYRRCGFECFDGPPGPMIAAWCPGRHASVWQGGKKLRLDRRSLPAAWAFQRERARVARAATFRPRRSRWAVERVYDRRRGCSTSFRRAGRGAACRRTLAVGPCAIMGVPRRDARHRLTTGCENHGRQTEWPPRRAAPFARRLPERADMR